MMQGVLDGPGYTTDEMQLLKIGHCVLIIGYGVWRGRLFWLVRNSWGEHQGLNGHWLIARNTGVLGGAFGINRHVTFPAKWSPNRWVEVMSEYDLGIPLTWPPPQ
jgi:hypothetical protein